jgi:hypothetical protein
MERPDASGNNQNLSGAERFFHRLPDISFGLPKLGLIEINAAELEQV